MVCFLPNSFDLLEPLGTIDYLKPDGKVVYRTCPEDYPNVFQIGTSNAVNALQVALKVYDSLPVLTNIISYKDVAAIDINMGCPKHFSVQGGMGAALLSKPETVRDVCRDDVRVLICIDSHHVSEKHSQTHYL